MAVSRIENAIVLTMVDGMGRIDDGVVQWEGNRITYAGPTAGAPQQKCDRTIDGTGCVVLPGLVNAHTHLAMTLFRGFGDDMPLKPWLEERIWPTEARLVEEDVYWGTRLGVLELLRGGVTCFNDMYHFYRPATEAARDGMIRVCPSGVLLGFSNDPYGMLAEAVEFTAEVKADDQGRVHPMLGPHAPYTCPDELLQRVREAALAQDIPVHIHISETLQEVQDSFAARGASPVQHLERLGLFDCRVVAAHCVHLDDADMATLIDRQVGIAHCPGSNLKLGNGFAPIPDLLRGGAVVGLGTDGAASNNNLDVLEEAFLSAVVHKGTSGDPTVVKADEALRMATIGGARALGLSQIAGSLEPGKRADIAMVNLRAPHLRPLHDVESALIYSAHGSDAKMTVVDGEIAMQDGDFPGQDEEEIYRECEQRARRLCEG